MTAVTSSSGSEYDAMCEMIPAAQSHANTVNGLMSLWSYQRGRTRFHGHSVP